MSSCICQLLSTKKFSRCFVQQSFCLIFYLICLLLFLIFWPWPQVFSLEKETDSTAKQKFSNQPKVSVLEKSSKNSEFSTEIEATAEIIVRNKVQSSLDSTNVFAICLHKEGMNSNLQHFNLQKDELRIPVSSGFQELRLVDLTYFYGARENITTVCNYPKNIYPVIAYTDLFISPYSTTILEIIGDTRQKNSPFLLETEWQVSKLQETKTSVDSVNQNLPISISPELSESSQQNKTGIQVLKKQQVDIYPLNALCVDGQLVYEKESGSGFFDLKEGRYQLSIPTFNIHGFLCEKNAKNEYQLTIKTGEIYKVVAEVFSQGFNPKFTYNNLDLDLSQVVLPKYAIERKIQTGKSLKIDLDLDTLQASLDSRFMPKFGQVELKGAQLIYRPHANFLGKDQLQITLAKANGAKANLLVEIYVQAKVWDFYIPFPKD